MNRRVFLGIPLLVLGLPARARGTQIGREPLDEVLKRTTVALVGELARVGAPVVQGIWREVTFTVKPVRTVLGTLPATTLVCRYAEGMPHKRGEAMVSPLVSGSGLEFRAKRGERVILLLSEAMVGKARTLLRIEPLAHLDRIPARPPA